MPERDQDEAAFAAALERAGLSVPNEERAEIARSFALRRVAAAQVHAYRPCGHFPPYTWRMPLSADKEK